jgi:hypothetical protein
MTVGQLRATMGAGEYMLWTRWYVRKWQREEVAAQ